jgi:SAM-dependent methyltransferase
VEDRTRAHHREDRLPARRRFDEVECTVSHLLRFPHPALRGRRYGEALLQGIAGRGASPGRSGVVEIGGGAGHLAECAWRGEAGPFTQARWTSVDLSPSLLAAQRRRLREPSQQRGAHERWAGLRADAVQLPFRSGSIDGLVLANEVIADLPVADGRNAGAIELVGELSRVLAPSGMAVLTEFGGDFAPRPVRLHAALGEGEHVEWTIDFRALRASAAESGLEAREMPLHELISADLDVRCASYTDLWRLRRLASCEVFAAPEAEVRRRFPVLSRVLALELPPLGSPRWPDATAEAGFAQLFRALLLCKR